MQYWCSPSVRVQVPSPGSAQVRLAGVPAPVRSGIRNLPTLTQLCETEQKSHNTVRWDDGNDVFGMSHEVHH